MSTYREVLSQAQNLTPDEQQQLLEVLSALMRDRVTTQTQGKRSEIDAALIEMAQDPEYQAQVLQMEAEFAVASIEKAILQLPADEYGELLQWLLDLDYQRWDEQLEKDIIKGSLDFLAEDAISDFERGNYRVI
jgi:hypothetical protein